MTAGAWENQEPLSASLLAESADDLMDDLFAEVETMLRVTSARNAALRSGTVMPPSRIEPPPLPPETPITAGKLALRSDRPVALEKVDLSHLELPALVVPEAPMAAPPPPTHPTAEGDRPERFVDRLLIFAALFSVLTTVLMWSLQRGLGMWQTPAQVSETPTVPVEASDPVTAQFADNLRRSLASLNTPPSAPTSPASPNVLPPINAVGGIQPIYIPVYQPPAVPPQALSPSAPAVPAPEPVTAKPAPPPAIAVPPKVAPAPSKVSPPAPEAPALRYTLLGVLELGDRASAMIEGNGTVQTVQVGELVVGSNWILNSINGQEATFTRGREARTVGVGQKF